MAKDPAVLFYTSDFLSGTFTMTNEQVGKYIRLLCLQHQKGCLSEKDMLNICSSYDEDIFSKFSKIEGNYVNVRMMQEAEKRKKYSESRSKNKKNATYDHHMKNICKTYDQHMENENENVNTNVTVLKGGEGGKMKRPTLQEVTDYFEEKGHKKESDVFFNYYESNGWKVGKNPMKNWKAAAQNWIKNTDRYGNNQKGNQQRIDKADYKSAAAQYDFEKFGDTPVGQIFGITGTR